MTASHPYEAVTLHPPLETNRKLTPASVADLATDFSRRFILDGSDLKMLFRDQLLNGILSLTGSEFGYISEVRRDENDSQYLKIFGHALTDISWDAATAALYQEHLDEGLEFHNLDTMFGACLRSGEATIVSSPDDPRRGGVPDGHPRIHTFLGIPLCVDGEVRGQIGLANRPGGYDLQLVEQLQPIIDCCATTMVMAQAERDRNRARDLLTESQRLLSIRQLEEADTLRAQEAFVSAVMHEMRTPVSALLVFATALVEDADEATQPIAQAVLRNTRRLAGLSVVVNDLLAPSIPGALEDVDLRVMVDQCIMDSKAAAQEMYGVMPTILASHECNTELSINQGSIARAVGNLLANAVKFGAGNPIEVVTSCDHDTVSIAVTDHGIGMSETDLAHCHEPFYRGAGAYQGLGGGTGLGLALADRAIRAHGGHLNVTSELGEGTCATIVLPTRLTVRRP